MDNLSVRKRGGDVESWSYDKVANSIGVAGMSTKEAEAVATLAQEWAKRNAQNGVISSTTVRDRVITILKTVDTMAADAFEAYRE